ncbi:MAG: biosynthetic peptidoglycan transglycosylase [bacterium]
MAALRAEEAGWPAVEGASALDDVGWLDEPFVLPVREGTSEGTVIRVGPGTPEFVPLAELPPYVGAVAYLSEEMGFYTGTGISLPLITKAIATNLEKGRFAYGGSTVTQQLVKNLFLSRTKTLARKFQEAIVSARIAETITKDRVLELYLNCIEFGPDVYGIGPAATHYFQKDARELTPLEATFLAMLKPAPRRGGWYVRQGRTPKMPYWDQRSRDLLVRLADRGLVAPDEADRAAPYILRWDADGRYLGADPGVDPPNTWDAVIEP